jgi:hypothetical protein
VGRWGGGGAQHFSEEIPLCCVAKMSSSASIVFCSVRFLGRDFFLNVKSFDSALCSLREGVIVTVLCVLSVGSNLCDLEFMGGI